jgi:hypothetical protein
MGDKRLIDVREVSPPSLLEAVHSMLVTSFYTHTHTRTRQPLPLQNRTLHGIVLLGGNFFSVARDWVEWGSLQLHSFFLLSTSHHHSLTHSRTHAHSL